MLSFNLFTSIPLTEFNSADQSTVIRQNQITEWTEGSWFKFCVQSLDVCTSFARPLYAYVEGEARADIEQLNTKFKINCPPSNKFQESLVIWLSLGGPISMSGSTNVVKLRKPRIAFYFQDRDLHKITNQAMALLMYEVHLPNFTIIFTHRDPTFLRVWRQSMQ